MNQPIRILQLTDLHLFSNEQTKLIGLNSSNSLNQVITHVKTTISKNPPALVALTGDISQDYSIESYETAQKVFSSFPCPTAAIMGNHDHLEMFNKFFGDVVKKVVLNNWVLLFLSTWYTGHVGGILTPEALDFLKKNLEAHSQQHVMIFTHHQLLPVNSTWIDKIGVRNADEFLDIIDQYQNIKAIICGHVHQEKAAERKGLRFFTTPSTSWQFATDSPNFKLDSIMPGYRFIDLYEDGSFKTEVLRVKHNEEFIPDLESKGY